MLEKLEKKVMQEKKELEETKDHLELPESQELKDQLDQLVLWEDEDPMDHKDQLETMVLMVCKEELVPEEPKV